MEKEEKPNDILEVDSGPKMRLFQQFLPGLTVAVSCYLLCLCSSRAFAQIEWQVTTQNTTSLSSPRAMDLNADGIKDVVIADGVEVDSLGHINAIDGNSGEVLWITERNGDVYSSAQFFQINNDATPDVVLGGRVSVLACLDGSNGNVIWEFDTTQASPGGQGWLQFYEPKAIADRNGDGIVELVVMNGGDPTAAPTQSVRKPGHLLLLDGATGTVLHQAVTPDSAESYCSVVVLNGNSDSDTYIYFGTGGETVKGSLWRTTLTDLLADDISNAQELVGGTNKGFIAPPVLADISDDGVYDVVSAGMDGIISVTNGVSLLPIWSFHDPALETYSAPGIGDLNGDLLLDVFVNMNRGVWPQYDYCVQLGFDGTDGSVIITDTSGVQISSPLVHDIDGNGQAEAIMSFSAGYAFGDCGVAYHRVGQPVELAFIVPMSLNIGSSPLLDDLDNDGLLDLITVHYTDTSNYLVTRWSTSFSSDPSPHWGAYHGSDFNGIYPMDIALPADSEPKEIGHAYQCPIGLAIEGSFNGYFIDSTGKTVLYINSTTNYTIQTEEFSAGLYILNGVLNDRPFTKKFILQ
jgi:hypothetical protein